MKKKIVCILTVLLIILTGQPALKGAAEEEYKTIDDLLAVCDEEHIAVYEANTDTLIGGKKANDKVSVYHLTKLMTALVVYDCIEEGIISYNTKLTTSEYANSMQGVQIWLDVGEEITVDELIKAITISNANDAAVVLAEGCCGSEERFVKRMNSRAKSLGLSKTKFADCTGISDKNVSTARDIAVLAGELARKDVFSENYKTRIAAVGCKAIQLVNQNRLAYTYKGCIGYKYCAGVNDKTMLCAASKQRDMAICAVMLGGDDRDKTFTDAKAVMNYAFTHNEIYYPETPEESLEDIPVEHGQKAYSETEINDGRNIIIERGSYKQIYSKFTREEKLTAPVSKGDKIGELVFYNDNGEILRCTITAAEDVKEMDMLFAFKSLLYNLFNI